jgi:transposase, IS5 family
MVQGCFSDLGMGKLAKKTRRAAFLEQMALVVPWSHFEQLIAPHYPVAGRGRRPYPLRVMLKIHFMQQWFGLSDPAMEEALWETPLLRKFAAIRLDFEGVPDETTILKFRHLLEKHALGKALFDEMAAILTERGLLLRQGTMVDATLIAAPPSTKNSTRSRDPEMKQTKKGNQWHFGMKVHVGADVVSGCVHSAEMTSANVHDSVVTDTLLHGEEEIAFGDSAYGSKQRSLEADREESDVVWAIPFKRKKAQGLTEEQRRINRLTSSFRSRVEHVFRIVKRQFGYTKTRYRGLYKNSQQIFCLLALANIYIMREKLPRPAG